MAVHFVWLLMLIACLGNKVLVNGFLDFAPPEMVVAAIPTCEPTEICAVKEFWLKPCNCPNNKTCGSDPKAVLNYHSVRYDFCQPPKLRECAEGEIAMRAVGTIRQIMKCLCPLHLKIMESSWGVKSDVRRYKCTRAKVCEPNEVCKVRNRFFFPDNTVKTSLKGICDCPMNSECEETGEVRRPESILEWEQEVLRCATPNNNNVK